uniref:Zinc finger protein 135like [Odobenus rosmarus divergens] n=1 Tax=Lepeophtheirus salmonis TaxID=72036 RepID=A0A0K2UAD2_LEPSM
MNQLDNIYGIHYPKRRQKMRQVVVSSSPSSAASICDDDYNDSNKSNLIDPDVRNGMTKVQLVLMSHRNQGERLTTDFHTSHPLPNNLSRVRKVEEGVIGKRKGGEIEKGDAEIEERRSKRIISRSFPSNSSKYPFYFSGGEARKQKRRKRRRDHHSSGPSPLLSRIRYNSSKGHINSCGGSPLSMDSGYGSLPSTSSGNINNNRSLLYALEEEDVFLHDEEGLFLCSDCGTFRREEDRCRCESVDEDSSSLDRRIEPFGRSSKGRTIGVVEPIVVQQSKSPASLVERKSPSQRSYRRIKYVKRRKTNPYSKSEVTSSDVDGDLDSYSSSDDEEMMEGQPHTNDNRVDDLFVDKNPSSSLPSHPPKDKNKYRQSFSSPIYLNSSVLSSQISSVPQDLDKKLSYGNSTPLFSHTSIPIIDASSATHTQELNIEDFRKSISNNNNNNIINHHHSTTADILQASIASLFDEPIPHVDDLLTNIDLQPMGGDEQSPVSKSPPPPASLECVPSQEKTVFKNEAKDHDDWIYCQEKGCGFWTRKTSRMERHISCHLPDAKYYKCPDCPLRFYSLAKMLRHDRRLHTGVKEYECRVCDAEVTDIQIHMRVHKEEKQFECHMCTMQFRHKNSLVRHLCQHTGERPYPCNTCDCAFVSLHRLKEHNKRYHEKVDGPPLPKKSSSLPTKPSSRTTSTSQTTLIYNQTENNITSLQTFPTVYSLSNSSNSTTTQHQQGGGSVFLLASDTSKTGLLGNSTLYIASPVLNSQVLWQTTSSSSPPLILHPSPSIESSSSTKTTTNESMKSRGGPFSCRDCGRGYKLETFLMAHMKNCVRKN